MTVRDDAKIWLDVQTEKLALGFDHIAAGLAEIIASSDPCFAVGIFADWGSGKTTLMKAIRKELEKRPSDIVCVDFNAWRFEREPLLLVPLLDTIRGDLADWAEKEGAGTGDAQRDAKEAAGCMARIVRGLAAGLHIELGLPGAFKIGYDLDKGMSAIRPEKDAEKPPGSIDPAEPQSLYFAAFKELSQAALKFNKAIRVVVFVDDLDRCLPSNALDVLESMKLFFDVRGFIFVAGLDERVVQQAVRAKLTGAGGVTSAAAPGTEDSGSAVTRELERRHLEKLEHDYVEKIFQVPYRLPQMTTRALSDLLDALSREPFPQAPVDQDDMRTFLEYIAVNGRVIPREVKKFLNTFTVQMLTHDKLEPEGKLKAEIVLVLQVLAFRYDWRALYDQVLTDWRFFKVALEEFQAGDETAFEELSDDLRELHPELDRYLRSEQVRSFARDDTDLDCYLSSSDSAVRLDPGLIKAYRMLFKLRRELRRILEARLIQNSDREKLITTAEDCQSAMSPYQGKSGSFDSLMRQLKEIIGRLRLVDPLGDQSDAETKEDFRTRVKAAADAISDKSKHIPGELRASLGLSTSAPDLFASAPETFASAPETFIPASAPLGSDIAIGRESYAARVMAIVEAALPSGWHLAPKETVSGYRFDGLIRSDAKNIAVETFYNQGFTGGEVSRAIGNARRSKQASIDAALVIARSPNAPGFKRLEEDCIVWGMPHKVVAWWPELQDEWVLTGAVRELIRDLGAPA